VHVFPHVGVVVHQQNDRLAFFPDNGLGIQWLVAGVGPRDFAFEPVPPRQPAQRFPHVSHRGPLHDQWIHCICDSPMREMLLPEGKRHGEGGPLAQCAGHGYGAAMKFH